MEEHKKRYVIEVQDRQNAVKLANPIVDLEDSVQRGISDPLADPRYVLNYCSIFIEDFPISEIHQITTCVSKKKRLKMFHLNSSINDTIFTKFM